MLGAAVLFKNLLAGTRTAALLPCSLKPVTRSYPEPVHLKFWVLDVLYKGKKIMPYVETMSVHPSLSLYSKIID